MGQKRGNWVCFARLAAGIRHVDARAGIPKAIGALPTRNWVCLAHCGLADLTADAPLGPAACGLQPGSVWVRLGSLPRSNRCFWAKKANNWVCFARLGAGGAAIPARSQRRRWSRLVGTGVSMAIGVPLALTVTDGLLSYLHILQAVGFGVNEKNRNPDHICQSATSSSSCSRQAGSTMQRKTSSSSPVFSMN